MDDREAKSFLQGRGFDKEINFLLFLLFLSWIVLIIFYSMKLTSFVINNCEMKIEGQKNYREEGKTEVTEGSFLFDRW